MKIVVLDSTAVCEEGPGSPAFFSRYAITHLEALGHDIIVAGRFDIDLCADADVVWTEWCNEDLFEAAASGVCKKLIARLRGFEVFGSLGQVNWQNVDHLCYESPFLQQLAEEAVPGLRGFRASVLPGGVDVANIPYRERKHGPVVAMVARAVADKGFQLAMEWARQRPDIQLHVAAALGRSNPRLVRYLEHTKPDNVTLYPGVDTIEWLDKIDANYLLSASHWESLGYTIAEAMAMGIRPLIHDTPGAGENWPMLRRWDSFAALNKRTATGDPYASQFYREFVIQNLDAKKLSAAFADLVLAPPVNPISAPRQQQTSGAVIARIDHAIISKQLPLADRLLLEFRQRTQHNGPAEDHRAGLAFKLAVHYYEADKLDEARVWALRSLGDIANPEVMCLLGEIADAQDDRENAVRWYEASMVIDNVPSLYRSGLSDGAFDRLSELDEELKPKLTPGPKPSHYLIVVAVRNAEKYIGRCLDSIKAQKRPFLCMMMDDASTDGTDAITREATVDDRFILQRQPARIGSLQNIARGILNVQPEPGQVIVIVDGDDELKPHALEAFDEVYARGAWMTYGNFVSSSGRKSWMAPYPQRVLRDGRVRDWPWRVSHPKTFRRALFDKIKLEDFQHEGQWFTTAGDVALMLPMLEMASERAVYIPDALYTYNDENTLGDHRVDPDGQVRVRDLIYLKPKYKKLEEL